MTVEILSTLVIHVRDGAGRLEKVVADGPKILIGSGAHCDVCLPPGSAAAEHLEVTVSASGDLVAHALADDPRATLRGAPFRRDRLAPGDLLTLGPITIEVSLAAAAGSGRRAGARPRLSLVLASLVACATLGIALGAPGEGRSAPPAQPPPLWGPASGASCPTNDPGTALAMAADLRARADAKRERFRFAIHEGIAAVDLLERAASCFRVGRQPERAAEVATLGGQLRARVNESYRGHHLRLDHALAVDEVDTALREVRILRAMTPAATGAWADWLTTLDRTLQQRQQKRTGS